MVPAALVGAAACSLRRAPPESAATAYLAAHKAVCETVDLAGAGSEGLDRARRSFVDRAHEPLHELAAALDTVDRGAAARLLEAKQRVEADLADPARAGSVGHDLDALAVRVADAMVAAGVARPDPCTP